MKKMRNTILLSAMVFICMAGDAMAQIEVRVKPSIPVYVRPERPNPQHVWIDEEWNGRGGNYEWHGGYWAVPPHQGWVWKAGHWSRRHDNWVWVPGHWRER